MHRCGSGFLLTLAIIFVAAFTGCLGKSSSNAGNGGVQTVSLSPGGMISIDVGGTQVFSATGKNASGGTVLGVNIQFVVASGSPNAPAPLSIASNGNACAGTWDASVAMCSPGAPGIALVTAVINGTSSAPTTVYVHQHVDNIQIVNAETLPPQYECFSQGQTWQYAAIVYSNPGNVDITNSVGPINWSSSNPSVVTPTPFVPAGQPNVLNQIQTTARAPGITQLFASVSGTTSSPYPYTTCLIKAIYLQIGGQGLAGNSITVNNGGTVPITATAVDTLYGVANTTSLTSPPLTWSTTNPEVAAFSSTTNTTGNNSAATRNNLGGATLTASCAPPTCNIGVLPSLPIYASDGLLPNGTKGYGTISVDVTSTSKVPTYTAWAATTDCLDAPGCSSALFAVTPGSNPIGSIVNLPRTPNSMLFNHLSSPRIYFGSDQGLMYVDVTASSPSATLVSNSSIPCNVSLCGKVLTISNDGKMVVVSDPPTASTPSQVYIYNGGSTSTAPVDLILSNAGETATAAAFSPDQLKVFILTDLGNMYIYSTLDALTSVSTFAPGTDVEFSADGSFAYVAGAPASAGAPANAVSAFSTCSLPTVGSVDIGSVATSTTPLKLFPSPVLPLPFEQNGPPPFQMESFFWTTQTIIALEPPNVEFLTAEFTQNPILYPTVPGEPLQLTCNPPLILSFTKGARFNVGQGNFTPIYSQLVNDGTQLIIVARHLPAVLLFNVSDGTTMSVPLVDNPNPPDPLSAAASTDGSQVYVAACDAYPNNDPTQPCAAGSVHIINTISGGDFQQVPYANINDENNPNMCNNQGGSAPLCLPNLIAIRPQ
ncbi:MAG TPA: hypothetical protein VJW96_11165 [Terriglobales bacterium]|nr:hypothetical protein [Terriglobales bacterium]